MAKNKKWSKEEDQILKELYNKGNKDLILSLLPNRNWIGIQTHASKTGLKRLNYFTQSELDFIKNNWETMAILEIGKAISRNPVNIRDKAKEMGFSLQQEKWTKEEEQILINSFGIYSVDYIHENILNKRSTSSIYHKCQELNLSKDVNRYSKEELLSQLINLSKQLGRTPITAELPLYGLAYNAAYDRLLGGYNNACILAGLEVNKTIFKQKGFYLSKNGDKCWSKSEQIITDFLIDNKIPFKKDKNYSSICKIGNSGKKRYDWLINGIVVEYFGLSRHKKYQKRMQEKINLCEQNNLQLLQIFDKDILKLDFVFKNFIKS